MGFMKKAVLFCLFCLLLASNLYPAMKIDNVISDLKTPVNLTDGDFNTVATGKTGTNVIILQFGNLRYIKELKVYLKDPVKIKYLNVFSSENFIEWRSIIEKNDLNEAVWDFTIDKSQAASFIRLVIVSETAFTISEIEVFDVASPVNKVTDVKIINIQEKSATVKWQTRIKSQGTVLLQKKVNGIRQTLMGADFNTEHTVNLEALLKGTEYLIQVVSQSPDGTRIESPELTFRTKGIPLPDIWELKSDNIAPYSAKINFLANVPVQYEVSLGTTSNNLKNIITQKKMKDRDSFEILGLQPETAYFYKLVIKDKFGNVTMTPPVPFRTPAHNIALGKKAVGTFNYIDEAIKKAGYGDTTVDKVVDGNLNYFGGMAISYNAENSDQYVVIDLEKAEPIKRLDIYWWGLSYSRDYRIDLSNNGKDWQTIVSGLDGDKGIATSSPSGDVMDVQSVPLNKTARLVRLYVKAGAPRGTKVEKWTPKQNLYLMEIAVIKDVTKN